MSDIQSGGGKSPGLDVEYLVSSSIDVLTNHTVISSNISNDYVSYYTLSSDKPLFDRGRSV